MKGLIGNYHKQPQHVHQDERLKISLNRDSSPNTHSDNSDSTQCLTSYYRNQNHHQQSHGSLSNQRPKSAIKQGSFNDEQIINNFRPFSGTRTAKESQVNNQYQGVGNFASRSQNFGRSMNNISDAELVQTQQQYPNQRNSYLSSYQYENGKFKDENYDPKLSTMTQKSSLKRYQKQQQPYNQNISSLNLNENKSSLDKNTSETMVNPSILKQQSKSLFLNFS